MTTLLTNGRIWQWSPAALAGPKDMLAAADSGTAHTLAEWMLLEGGHITSIGSGAPPEAGAAVTIDLGGRLVLPGLHDAHIHVYMMGATSVQVSLAGCASVEAMAARVAAHAAAHPELNWIVGIGWDQSAWGRYPTASDLDEIEELGGRPCWLWRACWHIGVGNSAALRCAGVSASSAASVEGGSVELGADGASSYIWLAAGWIRMVPDRRDAARFQTCSQAGHRS